MRRRRVRGVEERNNILTVAIRKVYLPNSHMLVFKTLYNIQTDRYKTEAIYTGTRTHTHFNGIINRQSHLTRKQIQAIQTELGIKMKAGAIQHAYLTLSVVTDDDGEKVHYQRDGRKVTTKRYIVRDGLVELHVEAKQSCGTKRIYNINKIGNGRYIPYMVSRLAELTA